MNDRGQMILVTGFAIAVAIVALVLLLNTAIYAENLATRNVDSGADDALAYRTLVEEDLWPIIGAENDREYDDRAELRANVTARVDRFDDLSARPHFERGTSANLSNRTFHDGTHLRQRDQSRRMTDASGTKANWTMAEDVDDVRAFDVNTTGELESTDEPDTESFRIDVVGGDGTGDRWSVYVHEDLANDSSVAVKNGSQATPTEDVCSGILPSGPPALNLTAGTIEGSDCDAIVFGKGASPPYEIGITYGNRSAGTYNATVNGTPPGAGNFNEPSTSPYEVPIVYSLSVDVVYETAEFEYRARTRLGPEGS